MSVILNIVSEFDAKGLKQAQRQFQQLEKTSDKVAFAMKKSLIPATAALTTLGAAAFKASKMASDLNEETSKANQIFGDASQSIVEFSNTASTKLGQSKTEALKAAGTFGVLGKAAGLTGTDLTEMSIKFSQLASDLASFNNTSPEDAVLALGAGLRGEAEPLRRYGVLLDDMTLRTKAVELQLTKTTKEALTPANKSLAAQAVILEKTALQQGNFALTSKDAANQQRILTARLKDAQTQIGILFLPILKETTTKLSEYAGVLIEVTQNTDKAQSSSSKWFGRLKSGLGILTQFLFKDNALVKLIKEGDKAVSERAKATAQLSQVTGRVTNKLKENAAFEGLLKKNTDLTTTSTDKSTAAAKKKAEALAKGKEATAKLKAQIDELADALRERLNVRLEDAQDKLKTAQEAFDNFGKSVGDAIIGSFNFGSAQSEVAGNAADVKKALDKQAEAQDIVNKAQADFNFFKRDDYATILAEAMGELAVATGEVSALQAKPMTFFDALGKQADKAKKFNELVSRLMAADLNETALQQVLAAGVDGGTAIAESILESADGVLRANDLTSAMQKLADDMGKKAATKYYKAGVDSATNFLKGIEDTIKRTEIVLANPNLTATDIAFAGAGAFDQVGIESLLAGLGNLNFGLPFNVGGMGIGTLMADGGVVTRATTITAGESGPEAIIPLDKMASMGFGGNNGGITINVNGGDPQAIVDALRRYQRQNGFVPITVGV
jgi:hypothetical protein